MLERYPDNGKILKVYGRFLEFVRNEPTIAAKFYAEALKHGTTESIMAMAAGKDGLTAVGNLNEKTDGGSRSFLTKGVNLSCKMSGKAQRPGLFTPWQLSGVSQCESHLQMMQPLM